MIKRAAIAGPARVLIVDDNADFADNLAELARIRGMEPVVVGRLDDAELLIEREPFDVAMVDYRLPDGSGTDLLSIARRIRPQLVCVIVTAFASLASTVSVAPNVRASSSFDASRSTAMMRSAPASRAPWIAFRPTPPAPMTTTSSPARTLAAFTAAPTPVMTPHVKSEAMSSGISSGTGAIWEVSTTTFSAKAPQFMAWKTYVPSAMLSGAEAVAS